MSQKEERLSLAQARATVAYDCETGLFRWLVKRNGQKKSVGWITEKGYVRIEFCGTWYYAHRLAWFLSYGEWPKIIDHVNGCKADNRLCNLREVDAKQNAQNQRRASKNNDLGILGVHRVATSPKYRAAIRDPNAGRMIHLGSFDTAEEAHAAYLAKKQQIHPGYAGD